MCLIYDIILHRRSNNISEDNVNQGMKDYNMDEKVVQEKIKECYTKLKQRNGFGGLFLKNCIKYEGLEHLIFMAYLVNI